MRSMLAATLSTLCTTLLGQELQCTPIEVSAGPQVCLCVTDPEAPDVVRFCLAELGGVGPMREFLRTKDPELGAIWHLCDPVELHRLDRAHLLLRIRGELVVVDVERGISRRLGDGVFVTALGSEVVYHAYSAALLAASWQEDLPPRRLSSRAIDRVEQVHEGRALVLVGKQVFWIDLNDATAEQRVGGPSDGRGLQACLSPNGRMVAIGDVVGGSGRLRVFNLRDGSLVQEWSGFSVCLSLISSHSPTVEIAWEDDDVLVCSQSRAPMPGATPDRFDLGRVHLAWVRLRVEDAQVLSERVYSESGMIHVSARTARDVAAVVDPWFRLEAESETGSRRLLRRGGERPLRELPPFAGAELREPVLRKPREVEFREFVDIADDAEAALVWSCEGIQLFQKSSDQPRHLASGILAPAPCSPWGFLAVLWLPAAD